MLVYLMNRCALNPVCYEMVSYGTWGRDEKFARGIASQSQQWVCLDSLNGGCDLVPAEPVCILQFVGVNGKLEEIIAWISYEEIQ